MKIYFYIRGISVVISLNLVEYMDLTSVKV